MNYCLCRCAGGCSLFGRAWCCWLVLNNMLVLVSNNMLFIVVGVVFDTMGMRRMKMARIHTETRVWCGDYQRATLAGGMGGRTLMFGSREYVCCACGTRGVPVKKLRGSTWITLLLLLFYLVPGLIYMIWRRGGRSHECAKCGSSEVIPVDSPRANQIATPDTHVKCPDCRELVLRDARKCKHCGCALIPQ